MAVHDGVHVLAHLVDLAVDVALGIKLHARVRQRHALHVVFDNVISGDQRRRKPARHQVVVRVVGMTDADVPEGIEDAVVGEDPVGGDEVLDQGRIGINLMVRHEPFFPCDLRAE
jgi:hypothetical protein